MPNILPQLDSSTQHVNEVGKPTKDFTNWLKSVSDYVNKTAQAFQSIVVGSPTGGNKGAGSINAQSIYINDVAVSAAALVTANNLSELTATDTTARANIAAAAQAQTFTFSSWLGFATTNGTYPILLNIPFSATITKFSTQLISGTVTAALSIGVTPVTGCSIASTAAKQSASPSAANVMSAGNDLFLVLSANASGNYLAFSVEYTRTLA